MNSRDSRFVDLLNENYTWPCPFPFKFIVPVERLDELKGLFPDENHACRPSRTGKYVSVSFSKSMRSSEEVVQVYNRVGSIEGVICL